VVVAGAAFGTAVVLLGHVHKAEETRIENKYSNQIADLTARISHIERRAGQTKEKLYVDVESMQVSAEEVKHLPTQHTGYDDGSFFINIPISGAWKHSILSEEEIFKLGPLKSVIELAAQFQIFKDIVNVLTAHVWYSEPIANIRYEFGRKGSKSIQTGPLTPHVYIMKINRTELFKKQERVIGAMDGRDDPQESERVGDAITEIERLRADIDKRHGRSIRKSPITGSFDDQVTTLRENFERLFDGDTAAYIFVDALVRWARLPIQSSSFSFKIYSAQKRLNVLYIDAEIRISDAIIDESFDPSCVKGSKTNVVIRREQFFVSYGSEGYILYTEVPTCEGRSRAFDWVSQWLAGVRIVVRR
jgi:hypothetical protein